MALPIAAAQPPALSVELAESQPALQTALPGCRRRRPAPFSGPHESLRGPVGPRLTDVYGLSTSLDSWSPPQLVAPCHAFLPFRTRLSIAWGQMPESDFRRVNIPRRLSHHAAVRSRVCCGPIWGGVLTAVNMQLTAVTLLVLRGRAACREGHNAPAARGGGVLCLKIF